LCGVFVWGKWKLELVYNINMEKDFENPSIEEVLQMEEENFKKDRAQKVTETPAEYMEERAASWKAIKEKRQQELQQTQSLDNASANTIRGQLGIPIQEGQATPDNTAEQHPEYMNNTTVKNAQQLLEQRLSEEKPEWPVVRQAIYDMLTTLNDFAILLNNYGGDLPTLQKDRKQQSDNYNKILRPKLDSDMEALGFPGDNDAAWSGYSLRPEAAKKVGPNIKVYETIDMNQPNYIESIPALAKKLREIAVESDDSMDIKVPNGYLGFLKHNDSIVVHFKNQENATKVQEAINSWMAENNIKQSPRELGRTKVAIDQHETEQTDKSSFSELVADNIQNWVEKHHGSYDPKILAEQAIIHAIDQSSKPPKITKFNLKSNESRT